MTNKPLSAGLHGLLLVRKPEGVTSHDVVARARKILGIKEVGHCGTLDPMAQGLLVLAVGEATKISGLVTEESKAYEGRALLGLATDSGDVTGAVMEKAHVTISVEQLKGIEKQLQGELALPVPRFSAVQVEGQRLYNKARAGEDFEPPQRVMRFWDVNLELLEGGREVAFSFFCSKGSYVRSWVEHLGRLLGVPATLSFLLRTRSGSLDVEQALELDELAQLLAQGQDLRESRAWLRMTEALNRWQLVRVEGQDQHLLVHGQISKNLRNQLIRLYQPGRWPWRGFKVVSARDPEQLLALVALKPHEGFYIQRGFRYL